MERRILNADDHPMLRGWEQDTEFWSTPGPVPIEHVWVSEPKGRGAPPAVLFAYVKGLDLPLIFHRVGRKPAVALDELEAWLKSGLAPEELAELDGFDLRTAEPGPGWPIFNFEGQVSLAWVPIHVWHLRRVVKRAASGERLEARELEAVIDIAILIGRSMRETELAPSLSVLDAGAGAAAKSNAAKAEADRRRIRDYCKTITKLPPGHQSWTVDAYVTAWAILAGENDEATKMGRPLPHPDLPAATVKRTKDGRRNVRREFSDGKVKEALGAKRRDRTSLS